MSRYQRDMIDEHILVSFDPGKRLCGVAIWDGATGLLIRAATIDSTSNRGDPVAMITAVLDYVGSYTVPVLWVLEVPQKYKLKRATYEGVDSLEAVLSVLRTRVIVAGAYTPMVWKASIPKAVHHRRLAALVRPAELIGAEHWDHNTWDAVGIGLFALGRSESGGRTPRK